jgi:uncharacterized protein with GYD domain
VAKYLFHGSYSTEGVRGLLKDGGSKRRAVVQKTIEGAGGKLEALYWAFGKSDVIALIDAPDNVTVAALSLAIAATGAFGGKTTVLLTAEEIDAAAKKVVKYTPPGA